MATPGSGWALQCPDATQVLVGAVISFVSNNETQTFQCVGSLLEDGTDVLGVMGDRRKGLATRKVTEVNQGVYAISDFLDNKAGTKENCAVDADHVEIVLKTLKAHHNPKKLMSHVLIRQRW